MPNFLIIGAAKCGTSSLYHYLQQHPQIFMSPWKEPAFFAYEGKRPDFHGPADKWVSSYTVTDVDDYRALFAGVTDEIAVGEASPAYLHSPEAPQRIQHHIPGVKLIAILRNPVDRAYSMYRMFFRQGREPIQDFAEVIRVEGTRMRDNWAPAWYYVHGGMYYAHLQRYYKHFSHQQIRVYLMEDYKTDPHGFLCDVFGFLGVDETFEPDVSVQHNVGSHVPKNQSVNAFLSKTVFWLAGPNPIRAILRRFLPARLGVIALPVVSLLKKVQQANMAPSSPLLPEVRQELQSMYREDILQLENLIDHDLSAWLA